MGFFCYSAISIFYGLKLVLKAGASMNRQMIKQSLLKGELQGWAEFKLGAFKAVILVSNQGLVALEPFCYGDEIGESKSGEEGLAEQLAAFSAAGIKPLSATESASWSKRINEALLSETLIEKLPLDLRGTPFQLAVWAELLKIPKGETISYAQLAAKLGKPKATRAVGTACGTNPIPFLVPCHRVVRSDGSLGGFAFGLPMKEQLLAREKIDQQKNRLRIKGVFRVGTKQWRSFNKVGLELVTQPITYRRDSRLELIADQPFTLNKPLYLINLRRLIL